jgi:transcriptional regulator with XRE-family HTH domain
MGRLKEILASQKGEALKIGEFLKSLRLKFSLTQEEICKKIEVSRPTLQRIETNKAEITLLQAKKLADFYNITLFDLINCEDKMSHNIRLLFKEGQEEANGHEIFLTGKRYNLIKELILYILTHLGSLSSFNEVSLNDTLFIIEIDFVKRYKTPFLSLPFLKNNYGPTPLGLDKIISQMIDGKILERIISPNFKFPSHKYLPLRDADLKIIRADEIKIIDGIIDTVSRKSAKDLLEYIEKIEQYQKCELFKKIVIY